MAQGEFGSVLPFLRRLIGSPRVCDMTDGQLLTRFITHGDQGAFEMLLRRHGPMVLGVCRRLLAEPMDVEDAFQATFLVLVRRAPTLGRRELVGNWLYGVAHRVALRARAQAMRRREVHKQTSVDVPSPESPCAVSQKEMRDLLDEEVLRLPAKYRQPFILCFLQGRTNEQAAHELGVPKGTVATRLARARERLRARLTCRGVALSSVALAAVLTAEASAAVPPALAAGTAQAACALLGGKAALAGAISAQVLALTHGMVRDLFLAKLKALATAAMLMIAVTVAGLSVGRVLRTAGLPTGSRPAVPACMEAKEPGEKWEAEADASPVQESREFSGPGGPFLAPVGAGFQSIRSAAREEAAETHFSVGPKAFCFVITLDKPTVRILYPAQPIRKHVTVYTIDGQAIHVSPRNGPVRGWDLITVPEQPAPVRRIYVVPMAVSPDEYLAPTPGRRWLRPEEARQ